MDKGNSYINHKEQRGRELLQHNILYTPEGKELDDLKKIAAYLCDVKYAYINFPDHDRSGQNPVTTNLTIWALASYFPEKLNHIFHTLSWFVQGKTNLNVDIIYVA